MNPLHEDLPSCAPNLPCQTQQDQRKTRARVSHLLIAETNLNTAAGVADRLYAIDRGEIIFEGDPRKAFEDEVVMKTLRG